MTKNIVGILLAVAALSWYFLRAASTHYSLRATENATGWPFPMMAGRIDAELGRTALWFDKTFVTSYDSILWGGLLANLMVASTIAVAFYSLASRLSIVHLLGVTAFTGWFLNYHSKLFSQNLPLGASIALFTRELTPFVVLVVCLALPAAMLKKNLGTTYM